MTPSYALGLSFLLCVTLIWAAASVVVQHLYRDMDFESPFLLTYISVSLFVLWIPTRLALERRHRWGRSGLGRAEYDRVARSSEVEESAADGRSRREGDEGLRWLSRLGGL